MKATAALLTAALAAFTPRVFAASDATLASGFASPPAEARPVVRWWWFGPAVVKPQLAHELQLMKAGGFGGFEVQPTYPLALDGQYPGLKNVKFGSPAFHDLLGFTAAEARRLGLRMDLTLGSGWPYGGPQFTRDTAAQSLADAGSVAIAAGQTTVAAPAPKAHDRHADGPVVAALLGPIPGATGADRYVPLTVNGREAQLPADLRGATAVRFFVRAPAELMRVKRAAFGDEGYIVDHYNPAAIETFIRDIAEPEIAACGPNPPDSVFCDSLEIVGEGWTPNLPAEFRRRRGYDLVPLLPALFDADFPHADEIRGDYGRTVAEVFDAAFVDRFTRLAHEHHTRFRLQAYGTPPTTLTTYAHADIDEGENYRWRTFSGLRWAVSASHLLGRAVTSSEAFTWLHSPVFMAAPIDLKAESNLQFLSGVNQLLYHGWPYTAPGVEYPGWRFYAAAVFNDRNPWWLVMPEINRYLARTSFLLRQGTPVVDVAVYLPEEDAFSAMTPTRLQMVGAGGNGLLNPLVNPVVEPILNAGYAFDGIDAGILAARGHVEHGQLVFGAQRYRAVVLPKMTRISLASLRQLAAFADEGGTLIAVDAPPARAPGYLTPESDQQEVRALCARLFSGPNARGVIVPAAQVGAALARAVAPDLTFGAEGGTLGFVHRRAGDSDLYFIANPSNAAVTTTAAVRASGDHVQWWDADTGTITPAATEPGASAGTRVVLELPPYGARFLVITRGAAVAPATPVATSTPAGATIDLSRDWEVSFHNAAPEPDPAAVRLDQLTSWTEREPTKYFSGVATYTKSADVPASVLAAGTAVMLDFGAGRPEKVAGGAMGMRADFQPPIGDAAVVYVNGQRAGALWCPPYRLDVTPLLHPGRNELRIEVANRAVNFMADTAHHPLPDYTALNHNPELGGNRFQPQDLDKLQTTPSGLLDRVALVPVRMGR